MNKQHIGVVKEETCATVRECQAKGVSALQVGERLSLRV